MQERGFLIYDEKTDVRIEGGKLWQAKSRDELGRPVVIDEANKTMSIYIQPSDNLSDIRNDMYTHIGERDRFQHLYFALNKRMPSIMMLVPVTIMIVVFSFLTVYGDLVIDWVFMNPDEGTVFGVNRRWSLPIYAIVAIAILYISPALVTAEQEGFIQAVNKRLSRREVVKKRFISTLYFFKSKKIVDTVIIWNPCLLEHQQEWVRKSLIPALVESKISVRLQIKLDERSTAERYIAKLTDRDSVDWKEEEVKDEMVGKLKSISYDYLESWEKSMLAVYVFASTANLPKKWSQLEGKETDGVLRNAVSLRLVEEIVERFQERLFSEEDRKNLISFDAFASRCVNDFGILTPCLRYTNDVWAIADEVVQNEIIKVQEEMRYITSYLQGNVQELAAQIADPAAALILNGVNANASIYNYDRLDALRFFVRVIRDSEQYKILKKYWRLLVENPTGEENLNEDVYRIIGVELLDDLATLFEKAAMYDHARNALDYIETVYPYRGRVGKARISERQGNFRVSVSEMLQIRDDWKAGKITMEKKSVVDLGLNIAWAIVSGRLEDLREIGREVKEEARELLYSDFDKIRNSTQIIRLYNITANYEEWSGNPEASLANYAKALQIPGVQQWDLSNLLVNNGIALRQKHRLVDAAKYGELGVEIKTAIGDADQLPIALHNLAQTYIELAFSIKDKEQRLPYFEKAREHAQTGLDIQAQTGSVKKRGQLLTERFVGVFELVKANKLPTASADKTLTAAQEWMKGELKAGRGETYDCRVVATELMAALEEFDGKTLEDCIGWDFRKSEGEKG